MGLPGGVKVPTPKGVGSLTLGGLGFFGRSFWRLKGFVAEGLGLNRCAAGSGGAEVAPKYSLGGSGATCSLRRDLKYLGDRGAGWSAWRGGGGLGEHISVSQC